jgi:L-fuconolactonase
MTSRWDQWLDLQSEEPLDPGTAMIDPHHHLWDRGGHRYLPAEFRQDAGSHPIIATVYVECLSHYRSHGPEHLRPVGETEFVAQLTAKRGRAPGPDICAGIIGFADLSLGRSVADVLDAHESVGQGRFKGIRYVTAWDPDSGVPRSYPTAPGMLGAAAVQASVTELASRQLSLDLWVYFHQLKEVAALATACDDLPIVVNHCGGPIGIGPYLERRAEVLRQWTANIQCLRPCKHVAIKFGGLTMKLAGYAWRERPMPPSSDELAGAWKPYFDVCLDTFGPERLMFESNFPVDRTGCSYTSLWNAFTILASNCSLDERRAMFLSTARRIYRL